MNGANACGGSALIEPPVTAPAVVPCTVAAMPMSSGAARSSVPPKSAARARSCACKSTDISEGSSERKPSFPPPNCGALAGAADGGIAPGFAPAPGFPNDVPQFLQAANPFGFSIRQFGHFIRACSRLSQ